MKTFDARSSSSNNNNKLIYNEMSCHGMVWGHNVLNGIYNTLFQNCHFSVAELLRRNKYFIKVD